MSRMPAPEVKFNEIGDGVKIGEVYVNLEKCPKRSWLKGGLVMKQEYKLMVWTRSEGADRYWTGKRFTP